MKRPISRALSMRTKMTVIIALFTAVILLVIWLLFVVFLNDFYRAAKYREIQNSAQTVLSHINDDTSSLYDTVADICQKTDASVLIIRTTELKSYS